MLKDIVVDTNVFLHASNPGVTYYSEAKKLIIALERVPTALCVDEGFDVNPARNRSLIGNEYLANLHVGMLAYALVFQLASTGRIRVVTRSVTPTVGKRINRIIPTKGDRVFLKVATNSLDRFLTSHDFYDFSSRKRVKIEDTFDVRVKTAGETLPFVTNHCAA